MAAKNVDFKWYQYTDNAGHTHSMKVSKLVGEDASFGFGAVDNSDPILTQRGASKGRIARWIDTTTGRMTSTPVGAPDCTKWTDAAPTYTGYGKDTTTDIVYALYGRYEERIRTPKPIVAKPEPA